MLPPLPLSAVKDKAGRPLFDAFQLHQYAVRYVTAALKVSAPWSLAQQPPAPSKPGGAQEYLVRCDVGAGEIRHGVAQYSCQDGEGARWHGHGGSHDSVVAWRRLDS